MTLRAIALVLIGCAAPVYDTSDRPATFDDLALGDRVPQATVDAALEAVRECLPDCNLDGWRAHVVDDGTRCFSGPCFVCPATTMQVCGSELPAGCESEAECPCECGGTLNYESKRIALAPGLASLQHEITHACGVREEPCEDLNECPEWSCQ